MSIFKRLSANVMLAAVCAPAYAADEVVVTNERRAQSAQSVALSVDAVPRARLTAVAPIHLAELLNTSAGVNIHRGSGQEHLTAIRSPVLTGGSGAGSFLYLLDGVPLRAAGFGNVNGLFEALSELSGGVEVIKGPGSALYGSNALHGLINFKSRAPQKGFGGDVTLIGSHRGAVSAKASVTGNNMRLSASAVHDDGFRDDSGFDQQKAVFRGDSFAFGWDAQVLLAAQNLNQETAGFIQTEPDYIGPDIYTIDAIARSNPNPEAYRDGRSVNAQVRLAKPLSSRSELVLTPYMRATQIEFLRHFIPGQAREENAHKSAGLQSAIYGADWVIGADAEFTKGSLFNFQDGPTTTGFGEPFPQGPHYNFDVEALVLAAFGQKRFSLSDALTAEIGLRAEHTEFDYDNRIDSGVFGRIKRVDDRSDDFFTLTPSASLLYAASPNLSVYGRAARGARAPQVTDLYAVQIDQVPGDANVETLDSLELGAKYRSETLTLNAALFAMKKDNFFFRRPNGFNQTDGETTHTGVELDGQWAMNERFSLRGSVTYARHLYDITDAVSGITSGDFVDTAPETLGTLTAVFRPVDAMSAELEWRHVGAYFTDPQNNNRYDGHDILVARWAYDFKAARVFARMDNLLDADYADRADFAFGNERYFPGRPRTAFIGLSKSF